MPLKELVGELEPGSSAVGLLRQRTPLWLRGLFFLVTTAFLLACWGIGRARGEAVITARGEVVLKARPEDERRWRVDVRLSSAEFERIRQETCGRARIWTAGRPPLWGDVIGLEAGPAETVRGEVAPGNGRFLLAVDTAEADHARGPEDWLEAGMTVDVGIVCGRERLLSAVLRSFRARTNG